MYESGIFEIKYNFNLTHNTPLIHTSFTHRKLNMDEICGLKFYLLCALESGIDVGQGITVGPGKFVKKNKRRALNKRRA